MVGAAQTGEIEFLTRFTSPYKEGWIHNQVELAIFDAADWLDLSTVNYCEEKHKYRVTDLKIVMNGNGEWSEPFQKNIKTQHSTQVLYFVVFDCGKTLHQRDPDMPAVEIEIKVLNEGSQFGQEEWYVMELEMVMWVSFVCLFATTAWRLVSIFKKNEVGESPLALLVIAIFVELG